MKNANFLMNFKIIIGFVFQYEYTQPSYSQNVHHLVRIILNSLEAQFHRCKRIPATVVMEMPARSRGNDYLTSLILLKTRNLTQFIFI